MFQNQTNNELTMKYGCEYGGRRESNCDFHQHSDSAKFHQLIYNSLNNLKSLLYLTIIRVFIMQSIDRQEIRNIT